MKIAVTAVSGEGLESLVDSRFGRARFFIVHDTESGETVPIDNSVNVNAQQGAGIQAAESIAGAGAKVLLTGHCGPNAFKTLSAAGIKVVIGASGTVKQAIEDYLADRLKEAEGADVEGHH